MRKPKGVLLIALLSVAAVLAACNGANNGGFPVPAPPLGRRETAAVRRARTSSRCSSRSRTRRTLLREFANIYVSTKGQLPPSNLFDFLLSESNGGRRSRGRLPALTSRSSRRVHKTPTLLQCGVLSLRPLRARRDRAFTIGPDVSESASFGMMADETASRTSW